MGRTFIFGGMEYVLQEKKVLRGMDSYFLLENKITGDKLYLYCLPD